MKILESSVQSYFSFHYGIGFAIGLIFLCGYMILTARKKKSQGQSVSKKEILCGLALSFYLIFLLGGILLGRDFQDEHTIEPIPFWSYYEAIVERDAALALQMLGNVVIFIPFGVIVSAIWKSMSNIRRIILAATSVSLSLELVQLIFKLGLFEFDDIFHNTLGAVIGYGLFILFHFIYFSIVHRTATDAAVKCKGN